MSAAQKITVRFVGVDSWSRILFKGDNGRFYKTTELNPREGFQNLTREAQHLLFRDLHTCDGKREGEPCSPVNLENFILAEEA